VSKADKSLRLTQSGQSCVNANLSDEPKCDIIKTNVNINRAFRGL